MANRIIETLYSLRDDISAKLGKITSAIRGNRGEADKLADTSERSNKRISDSYKRTADSISGLRTALAGIAAFVGLDKLKDGIESVLKAGEDLDDLQKRFATAFGGIEQGAQAFNQVRELAKGVPQSFLDVSDAAIALKKAGFDPLDGSLQALLDNANATNQSQEQLIATIEALGKANIKGAVNIKSLVSLTEAGIPVFDLLGKAMGVSADRVRQLAESGQLGQDSIKLLVTALGQLRAGASADELGDLDSQLTKLKDVGREFLETIASSGSLDFFRKQLADLTKQAEDAAKSGKLQQIAKSISDGIVNGAKAIGGAAKFLLDHAGAVVTLTKAYAAFKISGVAIDLARVSLGFKDTGKAAGEAAKGADQAAKSIKGIPTNVRIALAIVGIDVAVAAGEELAKLYLTLTNSTLKQGEAEEKIRNEIQKNAIGFAEIAASLSKYREQQVLSADAIVHLSDAERKSYADRLTGLQKYLQSQILYLTNLDRAGLAGKDELDRLAALKLQLAGVKKGQDELAQATQAVADSLTNKLTPSATLLANKLGEIKGDAKAVGEEIGKAFEGFDLQNNISAVGDFATAFDKVASAGGKAADTLNRTLLESLKNLSGEDLLRFQTGASFAIGQLGTDAEKTSNVLKDTLEVALDKLGTKAEDTGVKFTKSGTDIIATFNTVASNAQATSQTIAAAFDSALAGVKTKDEAEALGEALKAAAAQGKIGLQELTAAGRDLDERLRSITASVSPLASQFDVLGIKSQAQLAAVRDNAREAFNAIVDGARRGIASQEDVRRAFVAYANAAHEAGAASDEMTRDQIDDQLELLATISGIPEVFVRVEKAGTEAGKKTASAFDDAKSSIDETADSAGNAATNLGDLTIAATAGATALGGASQGIALLTNEQLRLMRAARDEFIAGAISGEEYGRRVTAAISGVNDELAKQEEALRRFQDALDEINSEIAQESGDQGTSEDIRHTQRLRDLKNEFDTTDDLTRQQYLELIKKENELHELKLKNIKAQQDAQANADSQTTGGGTSSRTGSGGGTPAPPPAPAPQPTRAAPIANVTVNAVLLSGDTRAADELSRMVYKRIKQIQALER